MKKVFIIRKLVSADTIQEALKKEKKTPIHDCYLEENSLKAMVDEIGRETKIMGFNRK